MKSSGTELLSITRYFIPPLPSLQAIIPVITQKYIGSRFCINELYTADGDKKHIFPVMYEDVDFDSTDAGKGIKFVISSINWTMFRPRRDDYDKSLRVLVQGMREKGKCMFKLTYSEGSLWITNKTQLLLLLSEMITVYLCANFKENDFH